MRKKAISIILSIVMIIVMIPFTAFAEDLTPTITVQSVSDSSGATVDVAVSITNNPGILGASLNLEFDPGLTLVSAASGEAFSDLQMTPPGKLGSPCTFLWDGISLEADQIKDGDILNLKFAIPQDAAADTNYNVRISYGDGDIVDTSLNPVNVKMVDGIVNVRSYIPGDLNGDGKVNSTDTILLRRHLAGGYELDINTLAGDVNADGKLNSVDVILIRRYLAGGYDVVLQPGKVTAPDPSYEHKAEPVEYVAPTCTTEGHIAYYKCKDCGKFFSDEEAAQEIFEQDIIIPAKGHTVVIDKAVDPAPESPGLTEGSHCSECKEIIVAQVPVQWVPASTTYSIEYDIANGDSYLETLSMENKNPDKCQEGDSIYLSNLKVPGYQFVGWYDGSSDDSSRIQKIENIDHNMVLYAHWKKIPYTIQFKSDVVAVPPMTYTVDQETVLPTPSMSSYSFTGWSNGEGELFKTVPVGTIGNKMFNANWCSERNKAFTKDKLGDPIIYEDENNHTISFAYELGVVQNIPIYTVKDFGFIKKGGISQEVTETYSVEYEETLMESYARTIKDATTNSSTWTTHQDWNETTTYNKEYLKEHGITEEQADTFAKSSTNTYNVSNGTSGSKSISSTNASTSSQSQYAKVDNRSAYGSSYDCTDSASLDTSVNASIKNTTTLSAGVKFPVDIVNVEAGASNTTEVGLSSTVNANVSSTINRKGYVNNQSDYSIGNSSSSTSSNSTTANSSSSWNSQKSYGTSNTTSSSSTTTRAISEKISEKTGYGESYAKGGGKEEGTSNSTTSESGSEYESSVTYSTKKGESVTTKWTTNNTEEGYHRWVKTGMAHVFGVVTYDINNSSYSVMTLSMMDDQAPKNFQDYSSTTAAFNDQENSVIPFEIPLEVDGYVANKIAATEGLKFDPSSGKITGYSGTDTNVVIPEYWVVKNRDGTNSTYEVTGISDNAFKGNKSIEAVVLSDLITEIPDNAFAGCTSLIGVAAKGVTKIGNNAFAGCTSYVAAMVSLGITSLGTNAFEGVSQLYVYASNNDVAKNAVESGAQEITLFLGKLNDDNNVNSLSGRTMNVPESTESFTFNGYEGTYNDFCLNSKAKETIINRASFVNSGSSPLNLDSEEITLNQVDISNSGIGLILQNNNAQIGLQGHINVDASILCKNISLHENDEEIENKLLIKNTLYTYGVTSGNELLECNDIRTIDEATFKKMLISFKMTFNANGGNCSVTSLNLWNLLPVGELPVPTKRGYTFDGWYTEDGTKVTKDSVFTTGQDIAVTAHWLANSYKMTFNASGGNCSVTSLDLVYELPVGELPVPEKSGYTFDGWYTEGGTKVTKDSVYSTDQDITVTAHWLAWNTGDIVTFGSYEQDNDLTNGKEPIEWIVMKKENGKAMLLSKYGLDCIPYNEARTDVTWETCTLRSWLNSTFLNEAFSISQQSQIPITTVQNPDSYMGYNSSGTHIYNNTGEGITNLNHHVPGGNATQDQLFLLSTDEAKSLLGYELKTLYDINGNSYSGYPNMRTPVTAYAKAKGVETSSNLTTAEGKACCWWWLRSPGGSSYSALNVYTDGGISHAAVDVNKFAVRPALWVNIAS